LNGGNSRYLGGILINLVKYNVAYEQKHIFEVGNKVVIVKLFHCVEKFNKPSGHRIHRSQYTPKKS
jgi:ATP/ADP translocase